MKICGVCKIEKNLDLFAKKKNGHQYQCKECHKKYRKIHYQQNKQKYIRKAKIWDAQKRNERRDYLLKYIEKNPCKDCGETNPLVMEFDHVTGNKVDCISSLLTTSDSIFFEELNKCEVVCANCHRLRTIARNKLHWSHRRA